MRSFLGFLSVLMVPAAVSVSACSGVDSRADDEGTGGESASGGEGGGGGSAKGGSGGSSKAGGGSGGSTGGGTGGSSKSGGAGGSSKTGGSGGAGGSTSGGTGGTSPATGGSGGSVSAGRPAKLAGPGLVFSGQSMTFEKLVGGDAQPGYAYGSMSFGDKDNSKKVELKMVEVDDPALPEGTKYAIDYDAPADMSGAFNNILGFNWRENEGEAWKRFNAEAAGIIGVAFYMKVVDIPAAVWNMSVLDASNIPSSFPAKGDCSAQERAGCIGSHGRSLVVRNVWQEYFVTLNTIPDALELTQSATAMPGPLLRDKLMRLDFLMFNIPGSAVHVQFTGLRLLTEEQAKQRAANLN